MSPVSICVIIVSFVKDTLLASVLSLFLIGQMLPAPPLPCESAKSQSVNSGFTYEVDKQLHVTADVRIR